MCVSGPVRVRRFTCLALSGFSLQAVALLAFIMIGQSPWDHPFNMALPVAGFGIGTLCVFWRASSSSRMPLDRQVLLAAVITLGFAFFEQVLGFSAFPGLLKDTRFLSSDHLETLRERLFFFLACNMAAALVSFFGHKLWSSRRQ